MDMLFGFDLAAAEQASPEDARQRLRVIKHYLRAEYGDEGINKRVKDFLEFFGVHPELPWSVVGHFDSILVILKLTHKCKGRKCVQKYREKKTRTVVKRVPAKNVKGDGDADRIKFSKIEIISKQKNGKSRAGFKEIEKTLPKRGKVAKKENVSQSGENFVNEVKKSLSSSDSDSPRQYLLHYI